MIHDSAARFGFFRRPGLDNADISADPGLPSRAEPSRAEPCRAEPSRAEPSRALPSRAEPFRAEPSRADSSRAEPSELSRAEPSRAEPSRAEPSRAEPSRAEPSRAEPSRAEPDRAEPSRAEPGSRAEPSRQSIYPQRAADAMGAPIRPRERHARLPPLPRVEPPSRLPAVSARSAPRPPPCGQSRRWWPSWRRSLHLSRRRKRFW